MTTTMKKRMRMRRKKRPKSNAMIIGTRSKPGIGTKVNGRARNGPRGANLPSEPPAIKVVAVVVVVDDHNEVVEDAVMLPAVVIDRVRLEVKRAARNHRPRMPRGANRPANCQPPPRAGRVPSRGRENAAANPIVLVARHGPSRKRNCQHPRLVPVLP